MPKNIKYTDNEAIIAAGNQIKQATGNVTISFDAETKQFSFQAPQGEVIQSLGLQGKTLQVFTNVGTYSQDLSNIAGDTVTALSLEGNLLTLATDKGNQTVDLSGLVTTQVGDTLTGVTLNDTVLSVATDKGTQTVDLSSLVPTNLGDTLTGVTLTGNVLSIATDKATQTVDLSSLVPTNLGDTITGVTLTGTVLSVATDKGTQTVDLASLVVPADTTVSVTGVTRTGNNLEFALSNGQTITQDISVIQYARPGSSIDSVIVGSLSNQATAPRTAIVGGNNNIAAGLANNAVIAGDNSQVLNDSRNIAYSSAIVAAGTGKVYSNFSAIVGGRFNVVGNSASATVAGDNNEVRGIQSAIIGGEYHYNYSNRSVILGGRYFFSPDTISDCVFVPKLHLFENGGSVSMLSPSGNRHNVTVTDNGKIAVDGVEVGGGTGGNPQTLVQSYAGKYRIQYGDGTVEIVGNSEGNVSVLQQGPSGNYMIPYAYAGNIIYVNISDSPGVYLEYPPEGTQVNPTLFLNEFIGQFRYNDGGPLDRFIRTGEFIRIAYSSAEYVIDSQYLHPTVTGGGGGVSQEYVDTRDTEISDYFNSEVTGLDERLFVLENAPAPNLDGKVDKVPGMQLTEVIFTQSDKNKLDTLRNYSEGNGISIDAQGVISATGGGTQGYDDTALKNRISAVETGKVDKVAGKQLTEVIFTQSDKNKLDSLQNTAPFDDTVLSNRIGAVENRATNLESGKVDKESGSRLITSAEVTKLSGLQNYSAGSNITISPDGTISSTATGGGGGTNYDDTAIRNRVTTLETTITTKVDKEAGSRLITSGEINKLAGLQNYSLPAATSTTLGGVKAGTNISISADGTISSTATGGGTAGDTIATVYLQGNTLTVATDKGDRNVDLSPLRVIPDNSITGIKLQNRSVTSDKIGLYTINFQNIADESLLNDNFASESVDSRVLANAAVTTAKLQVLSVTNAKLADGAVSTAKLATNAVSITKLLDGAVITSKLGDAAVTTAKVQDRSITGNKIAIDTITRDNLTDYIITSDYINDSAVTYEKLSDDVKARFNSTPAPPAAPQKYYMNANLPYAYPAPTPTSGAQPLHIQPAGVNPPPYTQTDPQNCVVSYGQNGWQGYSYFQVPVTGYYQITIRLKPTEGANTNTFSRPGIKFGIGPVTGTFTQSGTVLTPTQKLDMAYFYTTGYPQDNSMTWVKYYTAGQAITPVYDAPTWSSHYDYSVTIVSL